MDELIEIFTDYWWDDPCERGEHVSVWSSGTTNAVKPSNLPCYNCGIIIEKPKVKE